MLPDACSSGTDSAHHRHTNRRAMLISLDQAALHPHTSLFCLFHPSGFSFFFPSTRPHIKTHVPSSYYSPLLSNIIWPSMDHDPRLLFPRVYFISTCILRSLVLAARRHPGGLEYKSLIRSKLPLTTCQPPMLLTASQRKKK